MHTGHLVGAGELNYTTSPKLSLNSTKRHKTGKVHPSQYYRFRVCYQLIVVPAQCNFQVSDCACAAVETIKLCDEFNPDNIDNTFDMKVRDTP